MSAPRTTTCCVVGGGPAGMIASLLLARAGIDVTLLESHRDFERDFRGDTIHPSTLELLDQIGLADRLHQLPHRKVPALQLITPDGPQTVVTFSRLRTRFPYVMLMPQSRFLEFLADEGAKYRTFHIEMGATVHALLGDPSRICGVGWSQGSSKLETEAPLTIAADGRFSRLRRLAGMDPAPQSLPMDVLWVRLPRRPTDPEEEAAIIVGGGRALVALGREREWQIGCVGSGGMFHRMKAAGLEQLQEVIAGRIPWLSDRTPLLRDWHLVNVLSVTGDRLSQWHRPGLLFIGDAAHTMLPIAGVGINCAIADAVEAVNVLTQPLRRSRVEDSHLRAVQRRRELPTRIVQRFQAFAQRRIVGRALASESKFRLPLPLRVVRRVPLLRDLPGRLVGLGLRRTVLAQ
jgi:2-polyprenyl-6-methoxyphenol hydroxylase-like FAD-dependent oxidoreductase